MRSRSREAHGRLRVPFPQVDGTDMVKLTPQSVCHSHRITGGIIRIWPVQAGVGGNRSTVSDNWNWLMVFGQPSPLPSDSPLPASPPPVAMRHDCIWEIHIPTTCH